MKMDCLKITILLGVEFIVKSLFIFASLFLMLRCNENEIPVKDQNPDKIIEGSWVKYSPYKWTHDGKPYHATYCTIFSDDASEMMKKQVGKFADEKFLEILRKFNFSNFEDLIFPTDRKKIDVYINKTHSKNIAAAYWGSIFITVRTSELDTARYAYLFKHELTHAFEFLIEGTVNLAADMWFTEGIAIYCGGGLNRINIIGDLEYWISKNEQYPNKGNPITIRKWEDYPEGADKTGYCTVFEIVMEYMLDPRGLNKSIQDVLNVFYDLRELIPFEESFQNNFGTSVDVLEEEVFNRLRFYLQTNDANS